MIVDYLNFDEATYTLSFLSFYHIYKLKSVCRSIMKTVEAYLKSNTCMSHAKDGIFCANLHLFLRDTMTSHIPDIIPHSRKIQEATVHLMNHKMGNKCKTLELSLDILTPRAFLAMISETNIIDLKLALPNTTQTKKLMKKKVVCSARSIIIDGHSKDKYDLTLLRTLNWISFNNLVSLCFRGNVSIMQIPYNVLPLLKDIRLVHTGRRTILLDTIYSLLRPGLDVLAVKCYLLVTSVHDEVYELMTELIQQYQPKAVLLDPLPLSTLQVICDYGGTILQGTTFLEQEYDEAISTIMQ